MAETKNREKTLMVLTGAAVVCYLLYLFVITPMWANWEERQQHIADLEKKLKHGEEMVTRETAINRQWDRMRTNALPSNTSLAEAQMLKSFDRWEHAAGITRVSIRPQWKYTDEDTQFPYMTLECRADYTGNMEKLSRFLYEVEQDPMGVKIQTLEIASRDDSGQQLTLGLQISGLLLHPEKQPDQP